MKKLKLKLNDLKVESFETNSRENKKQNTVYGFATETEGNITDCAGTAGCPNTLYDYTCAGWTNCPFSPC